MIEHVCKHEKVSFMYEGIDYVGLECHGCADSYRINPLSPLEKSRVAAGLRRDMEISKAVKEHPEWFYAAR